jgi:hypothetical protein
MFSYLAIIGGRQADFVELTERGFADRTNEV